MASAASSARGKSIVDALIEERAPKLAGHPLTLALARRYLYPLLHYRTARRLARRIAPLDGRSLLDELSAALALDLQVHGLRHVPAAGRALLIANHPTGIADGIAIYDALKRLRPDLAFVVNRDALRVAPRAESHLVPVEWTKERRSVSSNRATLRGVAAALHAERLVVMFPSGRMAYLTWRGLRERAWLPTVINFARKYQAPIVPLNIRARNSAMFYAFSQISSELRDVTLFHELLDKKGKRFELTFGPVLRPGILTGDAALLVDQLRVLVEHDLRPRPARLMPLRRRARIAQLPT